MFDRIRQIHLFAAFVLTTFILMYFVSGFVMIMEGAFERRDTSVMTRSAEIPGIHSASADEMVSMIKEYFDVGGQYHVETEHDKINISFRHPGTEIEATVMPSDSVTITQKKRNFAGTLVHFHRLHGYHGGISYWLWAFFYDLSALAMLIFAVTGVYLWYKSERTRWPGWLILAASTLFVAFTVYYLGTLN